MKTISRIAIWFYMVGLSGCANQPHLETQPAALISRQSRAQIAPVYGISRVPQDVRLAWSPPPEPDAGQVASYNLYVATESDFWNAVVIPMANVTNGIVPGLAGGARYYFAITDFSTNGSESDLSPVLEYVTPLQLDLTFAFDGLVKNVSLQSSLDLNQWSNADSTATNGVYRVVPDGNIPMEFFRAVGQSIEAL